MTACPVVGTYGAFSDYECIDTKYDLQSCGGCSSTGAGQDCTAIRGAWNVGCDASKCTGAFTIIMFVRGLIERKTWQFTIAWPVTDWQATASVSRSRSAGYRYWGVDGLIIEDAFYLLLYPQCRLTRYVRSKDFRTFSLSLDFLYIWTIPFIAVIVITITVAVVCTDSGHYKVT
jgi:hypothetical protein